MTTELTSLYAGQKFNDFEQFDKFFVDYCKHTKQIFCIANGRTVEQYNKHHAKELLSKLKYAYVKYRCICGGKERRRGTGLRQIIRSNKQECPAMVFVSGVTEPGVLLVQSVNTDHICTAQQYQEEDCGRMVKTCIVKNCRKRSTDYSSGTCRFFSIPSVPRQLDEKTRQLWTDRQWKWIEAAGYDPSVFELKQYYRICSDHFVSGQPSRVQDNVDWVPTLKLGLPPKTDSELRWQNWLQDVVNIREFLNTGELSNTSQLSEANKTELIQAAQRYYIENGTLYYRKSGRTQTVVVLKRDRDEILSKAHLNNEIKDCTFSHVDSEAMLADIEPRYKWSNMKLDIDDWIRQCKLCNPLAATQGSSDKETEDHRPVSHMDDGPHLGGTHRASMVTSVEQLQSSTIPLSAGGAKLSNAKAQLQSKKPMGGAVLVKADGSSKLVTNKVMLMKQLPMKNWSNFSPVATADTDDKTAAVPPTKKTVRQAAWLLHSIGLRMVRERVYDDLIDIQEQKESEGQLSANEQRQLGRLQDAFTDLVKQNRPFAVRPKHRCICGFGARSRLELELHRDYGSVVTDDFRYICCFCNLRNIRSPVMMAAHVGVTHGRNARVHTLPPCAYCPYCPYEQRMAPKNKLSRHVINCSLNFRIDRNLAPTAADADIPLFEVTPPPDSSVRTTAASAAGLEASSSLLAVKTSDSSAAQALSSVCTTVSAAGPVMTPAESQAITTTTKVPLAKLARLAPLPEGLGFEVCELCGAFLASQDSMMLHMTRAHKLVLPDLCRRAEKPIVSCDKCTERFWTTLGLSVHQRQMHDGKTEPASPPTTICPLCKRTRLTDVMEHLARQHRITLVDMFAQRYCSICQMTLHAARPFEHHMLTRHSDLFSDRASLYAAIVLVDRATRGRIGMVSRGRQLSVLSGATSKPSSESVQPTTRCPVCFCEFADDEQVQEHVHRIHQFVCVHCGRRCGSREFLRHHIKTAHSINTLSCELCGDEISVMSMVEHLQNAHMRSCAVTLTRVKVNLSERVTSLERKRRRGSTSSNSENSSNNDDDSVEFPNEAHPAAKKMKTL